MASILWRGGTLLASQPRFALKIGWRVHGVRCAGTALTHSAASVNKKSLGLYWSQTRYGCFLRLAEQGVPGGAAQCLAHVARMSAHCRGVVPVERDAARWKRRRAAASLSTLRRAHVFGLLAARIPWEPMLAVALLSRRRSGSAIGFAIISSSSSTGACDSKAPNSSDCKMRRA
eukprot:scaffold3229_cov246-Pinguiococcus_pyrenoidosus.AAC.7